MTKEQFQLVKVGDVVYCNFDFSKAYFGHGMYGYVKGFYTVVEKDGFGRDFKTIKEERAGYIPCVDKYDRLSAIPYCFCELKEETMEEKIEPENVTLGKGTCNKIEGALFIVKREVSDQGVTKYVIDIDSEHLFDSVMIGTNVAMVKGDIERLSAN